MAVRVLKHAWNPCNYPRSLERLLLWTQRRAALRLRPWSRIQLLSLGSDLSQWTHRVHVRQQKPRGQGLKRDSQREPIKCRDGNERKLSDEADGLVVTGHWWDRKPPPPLDTERPAVSSSGPSGNKQTSWIHFLVDALVEPGGATPAKVLFFVASRGNRG